MQHFYYEALLTMSATEALELPSTIKLISCEVKKHRKKKDGTVQSAEVKVTAVCLDRCPNELFNKHTFTSIKTIHSFRTRSLGTEYYREAFSSFSRIDALIRLDKITPLITKEVRSNDKESN